MSIFHNNILGGAASSGGAAADFKIERSLRFNKDDSAHLSRTPSSAGNRKTWTWSGWVKRANSDSDHHLFVGDKASSESLSNSTFGRFYIASNGKLYFSGYTTAYRVTSALLRDPAAWYHLVLAVDTTQSTADNRVKIYINGSQITDFDTKNNPNQNDSLGFNTATPHTIGARSRSGTIAHYHDGYLAEVHFVDGQQLAATDFGEEDDNGVWQPKKFEGSHNTSGRDYTSEGSTSGSFYTSAGGAASKMFDGSATTGAFSQSGTATFTFGGSTITASSSLKVRAFKGDASGANVLVNGTNISSLLNAQSSGGYSTVDITSTLGGAPINLSNVSVVNANNGSGNIAQIFVDDEELVDLTPGVNGFHLDFSDNSSNTALGDDAAGSNNWTVNNIAANEVKWSDYLTSTASFTANNGPEKAFDNSLSAGDVPYNDSSASMTWAPPGGLAYSSKVEIYVGAISGFTYSLNGASAVTATVNAWNTVATGSGTINTLVFDRGINETHGPHAIRVDDVVLVDGTPSNTDSLIDTPMNYSVDSGNSGGNYCTLNPLDRQSTNGTLSNGNLDIKQTTTQWAMYRSTMFVSSGKWYWECTIGNNQYSTIGVVSDEYSMGQYSNAWANQTTDMFGYYPFDGKLYNGSEPGDDYATADTSAAGSVIGVALDMDNGTLTFYKDGTSLGTAYTGLTGKNVSPTHWLYNQSNADSYNFGQRPFKYTNAGTDRPAATYLSLCTQNLDDPIADGSAHFDVKLYTGVETANTNITGFDFSPDFVWIKKRNGTTGHFLYDTIRGIRRSLYSNSGESENNYSDTLESFNSDGFTLGDSGFVNSNNDTYVAYAWEGASSNTSNTDGSITSSVRANQTAGFSIVTWSGNSQNATVGHGLGATPELILHKRRNGSASWIVYHKDVGNNRAMQLNSTDSFIQASYFDNKSPTSTIFNVSDYDETNRSGNNYVAYCFAPVEGYSAFRSHIVGSGTNFVHLGFRPRFVMLKRTGTGSTTNMAYGSWALFDTARDTFNEVDFDTILYANRDYSEGKRGNSPASTGGTYLNIDILSNGIRFQSGAAEFSQPSDEIIVMAWAENSFSLNGGLAR